MGSSEASSPHGGALGPQEWSTGTRHDQRGYDPAMGLRSGSKVAHFEIIDPVAVGGMGAVYRAVDARLGRTVALKVLHPSLATDDVARERFLREARTLAQVRHPAIPMVYDQGADDGEIWISMEFIDGPNLKDRLTTGPLDERGVAGMLERIGPAVDALHAAGVTHRDIKPANIVLAADGAFLVDFGIAKRAGDITLTAHNSVVGTATCMAPERCAGESGGAPSDIYALGCVAYEALTGHPVFEASRPEAMLLAHITQPVPRLGPAQRHLQSALDRALAKTPDQRFPSAADFVAALALTGRSGAKQRGSDRSRMREVVTAETVALAPDVRPPGSEAPTLSLHTEASAMQGLPDASRPAFSGSLVTDANESATREPPIRAVILLMLVVSRSQNSGAELSRKLSADGTRLDVKCATDANGRAPVISIEANVAQDDVDRFVRDALRRVRGVYRAMYWVSSASRFSGFAHLALEFGREWLMVSDHPQGWTVFSADAVLAARSSAPMIYTANGGRVFLLDPKLSGELGVICLVVAPPWRDELASFNDQHRRQLGRRAAEGEAVDRDEAGSPALEEWLGRLPHGQPVRSRHNPL